MAKILVVDDQFGVRCLLFEVFVADKHEVQMAENGAEALRLLISFQPDLILMDMKMPGMNGIETLRQIRELNCQAVVIMMSGYGNPQNMEQAKELGVLYNTTKPFDLSDLRDLVSEVLNSSGSVHKE